MVLTCRGLVLTVVKKWITTNHLHLKLYIAERTAGNLMEFVAPVQLMGEGWLNEQQQQLLEVAATFAGGVELQVFANGQDATERKKQLIGIQSARLLLYQSTMDRKRVADAGWYSMTGHQRRWFLVQHCHARTPLTRTTPPLFSCFNG